MTIATMTKEKKDLRQVMVDVFIEEARSGCNLMVLVSDSTSTSKIKPFMAEFPDRLVNVGIAEQSLVGTAAGMALGGCVAVTANAAPFLVARANEQVKNDVCYSNTNVKMAGLNAGCCYGPLASTHHAIDDLSIMRGLGNVAIFAPADPVEAREIWRYALKAMGPMYIRMDSAKFEYIHDESYQFRPGQVDVLREGADCILCAIGSVTAQTLHAAEALAEKGIECAVLNVPSLRPLDTGQLAGLLSGSDRVITVEEHSINGGLGSTVAELLAESGGGIQLRRLGIPSGQFAAAGPRQDIQAFHGFDMAGIVNAATELCGRE